MPSDYKISDEDVITLRRTLITAHKLLKARSDYTASECGKVQRTLHELSSSISQLANHLKVAGLLDDKNGEAFEP